MLTNHLSSCSFFSCISDWASALSVRLNTRGLESSLGLCVVACVINVAPSSLCLFCSRAHSPALGVYSFSGVQRFNLSSHSQSPKRHSFSHSPSSSSNGSFLAPETEPIVPELCIDHLWTETVTRLRLGVYIFILKEK